jgi:signal transduction histidine kinase
LLLANLGLLALNPEVTINNPIQAIAFGTGVGSVAGFAIGTNEARAISRGREADQGREVLGFLNSTLRHEVLNDLTVIRGTATELAKKSDADTRTQLDVIVQHCDELADLIDDIGPLSRTLMNHDESTSINLADMVADRVDRVAKAHPGATVTALLRGDAHVRGSEELAHAISNVLTNAIEHNDQETPHVDVSMSTTEETVRLSVADNGPGIDEGDRERIFAAETERDRGFGLYMTRTLVTHFDGEIRVEDNDPRGSVFTIELPRVKQDPTESHDGAI